MSLAIGIDLGTTHCVVASGDGSTVDVFPIPQPVAPGEIASRDLLPSFLFYPPEGGEPIVGELARKLGAGAPTRLVQSAKSWICHGGINRRAAILPWSAEGQGDVAISPFDAQVRYLAFLRAAWDAAHRDAPLASQEVVVTVPASFDESARELTVDAAQLAGLGAVHLLEEPQAAFYDFVAAHGETLKDKKLLLVVDVGGGTTDLTLVRVKADGDLERIAVGGHLLLGGDNMDAALAHAVIAKANVAKALDPSEWASLLASSRAAKELLLTKDAPAEAVVSVQRRGSRLIGGTISVRLSREDVTRILLDGFLPFTSDDAEKKARAGLTTLGLPYATDPAIPRHVATFLRKHLDAARAAGAQIFNGLPRPDGVLLNGGVFNGAALAERFSQVLAGWYGAEVPLLAHTSLDTAVARGAARYALARQGVGKVITGGTAHAYYIGVTAADGSQQALTVAPRGMNEGASVKIERTFDLTLGRRVSFPLYSSTKDRPDAAGSVVKIDDDFDSLPALETALHSKKLSGTTRVTLSALLTDHGALELFLTTVQLPPERWQLKFALAADAVPQTPPPVPVKEAAGPLPPRIKDACRDITRVFDEKSDAAKAKGLRAQLETVLGARGTWSAATCRVLADELLDCNKHVQSAEHELAWLRLVGWCLRPGYGAHGDRERVSKLRARSSKLAFPSKGHWGEWWIVWRRVAGGLDRTEQRALFTEVMQALTGPGGRGQAEMPALLGALERASAADKEQAGAQVLTLLPNGPFYSLGRLGARALLQGEPQGVVSRERAGEWIEKLLTLDWAKAEGASFAAAMIARLTGDGSRDLSDSLRAAVAKRLVASKAPSRWSDMVTRVETLSESDAGRLLGDALPPGLSL